jgi:ribosomal protein S12 methylthiotransferase accessory factor
MYELVQPVGGLMTRGHRFRAEGDEPRVIVQTVRFGTVKHIWPLIKGGHVAGAGAGLTDEQSLAPAVGEGVERYCSCIYKHQQFVSATAAELGNTAIDLDQIPRCSRTELSHPKCRLVAPDKHAPIRWVGAVSLLDGRQVFVPAVMVYLHPDWTSPAEKICYPISTGCAAHTSLEQALLNAILEVIERDAISVIWLQKLPLPRIDIDALPQVLVPYWELYQRSSRELDYIFFDGTTDLGLPTVYALQIARANPRVMTLVHCCTTLEPAHCIVRIMREIASCKIPFRNAPPIPESWDDFIDPSHGAIYMARAEQATAFEFLLQSQRTRFLSHMRSFKGENDKHELRMVLDLFRSKGLDVYAVELSTDEALRAGVRVVRVIIPSLQPLDFHYRARYLGHCRLYDAPKRMGHPVLSEQQLNRWPQPFF